MSITKTRLVQVNQVVFDQADVFEADGITRILGLTPGDLVLELFFQNVKQPWALVDGSTVVDAKVTSGKIYWSEIGGSPGIYSVRWRPNAVGFWRLLLTYTAGNKIVGQEYDAVTSSSVVGGLRVSFTK